MRTQLLKSGAGLLVLAVALAPTPSAGQPQPAPPPRSATDRSALSGRWELVELEADGEVVSAAALKEAMVEDTLTIDAKGGTFRRRFGALFVGGFDYAGRFAVAGPSPVGLRVELSYTRFGAFGEGPSRESEEEGRAVWQLVGRDRLRVCELPPEGWVWPEKLTAAKGDGREVRVYERRRAGK